MLKLIPNILTFARFGLTFVFLGMILYSPYVANRPLFLDIAFVLFVVTEVTDIVDGKLARRLKASSKLGRITDPLADKILVCGTFVCFAIIGEPRLFGFGRGTLAAIHWSVAGLLVLREGYVTLLRHITEARGVAFPAVATGKLKGVLQAFAIGTVIIKTAHVPSAAWASWFAAVTLVVMMAYVVISGPMAVRRSYWKRGSN
ncbi:MAG TPA: CDP-alcohol phosphatidyltransferase family protein [Sedimentisphaerales bacterium]|nr:CDP-alcohol phosphatidyltransferase family protein [Sedimentisphaerales bacterium]